ncbi:hypothetical protein EI545_12300 [Tabrizicola piscis]|uniref:DUF883 family protein n=1 Tax=Tabrizicola piscis TaxID=2494374 RepID=A0A3S8U7N6_9RHOB|nr:hypothetical protein [Tabrizicola piscis]AZL59545.1 hypothetical protein EI545_12300 [Tabrizicola piscis]
MLQDGKFQGPTASTDFAGLSAQFDVLRGDVATLTHSVTSMAEKRGRQMVSDISDGIGDAVHSVEQRGKTAEASIETTVASHSYLALFLAVGAGLMIGALSQR